MRDAPGQQLFVQRRAPERALPRLVHHDLPRRRPAQVHQAVAVLPAHQQPPHLAPVADGLAVLAALRRRRLPHELRRGAVREVGEVPLARVEHGEAERPEGLEEAVALGDDLAHGGEVRAGLQVAEAGAREEVALHVDHEEGGGGGGEGVGVGFGGDREGRGERAAGHHGGRAGGIQYEKSAMRASTAAAGGEKSGRRTTTTAALYRQQTPGVRGRLRPQRKSPDSPACLKSLRMCFVINPQLIAEPGRPELSAARGVGGGPTEHRSTTGGRPHCANLPGDGEHAST